MVILETRFAVARGSLREDVDAVIERLGNVGALTLERM